MLVVPTAGTVHAPYNPRAELIDATFGGSKLADFYPIIAPIAAPYLEAAMGDWLGSAWDTVTGWFSDTPALPGDLGSFDPGGEGMSTGGFMPGEHSTEWDILPGAEGGGPIISDTPGAPGTGQIGTLPDIVRTSIGGAIGMPSITSMASLLGIGGGGAARIMIKGVPVAMSRVWSWVKANPASMATIAAAAGMSVAQLAQLMMAHPAKRRRRRGISARDVRTTRRVVNFVHRVTHQLRSLGPSSSGGYRRGRGTTMIQQR